MARGDPHHVIASLFCLPLEVNIRLIHSNPPLSPFSIMHVSSLTTTSVCAERSSQHSCCQWQTPALSPHWIQLYYVDMKTRGSALHPGGTPQVHPEPLQHAKSRSERL